MPFRKILADVVANVDGAVAALFVDHQGEAVEIVGILPAWDLQVIGAYQGIFMTRIAAVSSSLDHGRPERFKIEWDRSMILNWGIDQEYYVALVLRAGSQEGLAWRALARGRDRIREEIE
ncbi:MAG TPA: hypothetical protein VMS56_03315 [Thermoanaerobaculia bacterium]|nr:hypothetical protein [Thermoanaerobaculia bacterium]